MLTSLFQPMAQERLVQKEIWAECTMCVCAVCIIWTPLVATFRKTHPQTRNRTVTMRMGDELKIVLLDKLGYEYLKPFQTKYPHKASQACKVFCKAASKPPPTR